ncbi:Uncharacterised protein [Bordetella pertussis]|nr:Uncharacterised protein [Bordetella pertussis]
MSLTRCTPAYTASTSWNSLRASSVAYSRPRMRSNSAKPMRCSMCDSSRLTAGCDTNRSSDAPRIEPVIMTARNTSIWRRLSFMATGRPGSGG